MIPGVVSRSPDRDATSRGQLLMIPMAKDPFATLVFFLLVFAFVGAFFLFIHLVIGSFIRPYVPDKEKLTIYECGEPTIGSAWVQFDLRYYVVALLFVIFDVEVAFFFPWATVFGKANQLADVNITSERRLDLSAQLVPSGMSNDAKQALGLTRYNESSKKYEPVPIKPDVATGWARVAFSDILVFFGVLMVGFAYLWRRGDINWVRTYTHHQEPVAEPEKSLEQKIGA